MRSTRAFCILLVLALLLGGGAGCDRTAREEHPPVHVTYTPDPTAIPAELIEAIAAPAVSPDAKDAALLYAGERIKVYLSRHRDRPGLCVESQDWDRICIRFQELPGTLEQEELTTVGVEVEPLEEPAEARVCIRYLDDDREERIICVDRSHENYSLVYPLSAEPSLTLSEQQERYYGDLLLMGYLYERIQGEKDRLLDPEGWESLCQRRILDALYYNYGDALPPYLTGEGPYGTTDQDATVISLAELESFFQSTLGRPCLAQLDFDKEDRKDCPDLRSDRIVLYPTDYWFEPHVKQAVREADGTIALYGYVSGFELLYEDVICRIHPAEGYLGGQVLNAKIYLTELMNKSPAATFAP